MGGVCEQHSYGQSCSHTGTDECPLSAGFLAVLQGRVTYQALMTWQAWAQDRWELRSRLHIAFCHWQHTALSLAFLRFRQLLPSLLYTQHIPRQTVTIGV